MESLKNLPLVSSGSSPIPADVKTYYLDTFAQGSGPNGTYLVTDFFGTAAGLPVNDYIAEVNNIVSQRLDDGTLTSLNSLYGQMLSVVTSAYGTPPAITIPSGPAAGLYADYDSALAALISAANSAITVAISAMGDDGTSLNNNWSNMAQHFANESVNQQKASVDFTTVPTNAQLPVTAFMTGLASYGTDTQEGMSAQFLESIADLNNRAGQALVGAMRDARNNQSMDANGIGHDNIIPSQPTVAPPQATLIDSQYTVSQARSLSSN